jgi:hypothetical protein
MDTVLTLLLSHVFGVMRVGKKEEEFCEMYRSMIGTTYGTLKIN